MGRATAEKARCWAVFVRRCRRCSLPENFSAELPLRRQWAPNSPQSDSVPASRPHLFKALHRFIVPGVPGLKSHIKTLADRITAAHVAILITLRTREGESWPSGPAESAERKSAPKHRRVRRVESHSPTVTSGQEGAVDAGTLSPPSVKSDVRNVGSRTRFARDGA